LLGVSRDTIERAMKDGRLKSSTRLGVRLIDARSIEGATNPGSCRRSVSVSLHL
jgi:hypothetical protein